MSWSGFRNRLCFCNGWYCCSVLSLSNPHFLPWWLLLLSAKTASGGLSAQPLCTDQGQRQSSGLWRACSGFLSVGQGLVWCITTCMQWLCGSCGHSATHFGLCPGFFPPKNFLCTVYYIMFMCYDSLQGCELNLKMSFCPRGAVKINVIPPPCSPPHAPAPSAHPVSEQSHNHMLLSKHNSLMLWMWCKGSSNSNWQISISLRTKWSQCVGFAHKGDVAASPPHFCSWWMLKDQCNGVGGPRRTSHLLCAGITLWFAGVVFAVVSFPAVQNLFDFQDASLMFVARRMKRGLEAAAVTWELWSIR